MVTLSTIWTSILLDSEGCYLEGEDASQSRAAWLPRATPGPPNRLQSCVSPASDCPRVWCSICPPPLDLVNSHTVSDPSKMYIGSCHAPLSNQCFSTASHSHHGALRIWPEPYSPNAKHLLSKLTQYCRSPTCQ